MSKRPVQFTLSGFETWPRTPVFTGEKLGPKKPAEKRGENRVTPNRTVLLCIFKKSQQILGEGHSLRTKSIITWDDVDGRERWVIDREIVVPGHVHIPRQLTAWETLEYIGSTKIEGYTCWRLIKPIPERDEIFPEVLV